MLPSENMIPQVDMVAAWQKFITTNQIDTPGIRYEIAQSWKRSFHAGVNPNDGISHSVLEPCRLGKLLHKRKELIEIAKPFMASLYQFVAGSGFIVVLSDENGFLLEVVGDDNTLQNAYKLNLIKGASWAEKDVGTNGIGTALAIGKPIQVSGAEHYCRRIHVWTCSAAPIWDDNNRVIGALQISGPSWKTHLHTLGMVVAAVEAIHGQLRVNQRNRDLTFLNHRLNDIFLTVSDGVIVLDRKGLINKINPVAEKLLANSDEKIKGTSLLSFIDKPLIIKDMMELGTGYSDVEITLLTKKNLVHCLSSGKPIKEKNGKVTGGVVFINPINKIKKLINRFSGALATFHFHDIIGKSPQLINAVELAMQAANNSSTVLLQGESGTGKEVFAQAIHNQSPRKNGPFIAVNCGAIPRELVGSELFGYEEGAFTGALRGGRPGKFEMASGGTIFLDEIGDMPLEHQVSLLRVLQDKHVTRVGGTKVILVDVRIICATNKDLEIEVAKGNFRHDLYYRLNVISIKLPTLRERIEDLPLLFDFFLEHIEKKTGKNIKHVDPALFDYLCQYDWPGNIREFQNVIERTLNMSKGQTIGPEHLPEEITNLKKNQYHTNKLFSYGKPKTAPLGRKQIKLLLEEKERRQISALLIKNNSNISQVARDLGISRNTLYRKLRKLQLLD